MTRLIVAPGQTVTSAWGNQVMDEGIIKFTSTAQRDADWPAPPDGASCYVTGVGWQRRAAGAWQTVASPSGGEMGALYTGAPNASVAVGATVDGNQTITTPLAGLWRVTAHFDVRMNGHATVAPIMDVTLFVDGNSRDTQQWALSVGPTGAYRLRIVLDTVLSLTASTHPCVLRCTNSSAAGGPTGQYYAWRLLTSKNP